MKHRRGAGHLTEAQALNLAQQGPRVGYVPDTGVVTSP